MAARANAAFARRGRTLPAPPVARTANDAVGAAIARISHVYRGLAAAATANDRAAYRRAGHALGTAEAQLADAAGALKLLGYEVQGGA